MRNARKTTLVIMAAGLGSRYGGSKQIDRIGPDGEILMQYSMFDAVKVGFDKIVFITKPEHRELLDDICSKFIAHGVEISFVYQDFSSIPSFYRIPKDRQKPFGTVHAVLCAKDVVNEPFSIINADDFYGADSFSVMHSYLTKLKYPTGLMVAYYLGKTVSKNGTVTRGVCEVKHGKLCGIKEVYSIGADANGRIYDETFGELDASTLVSMNMWGFTPEIFDRLETSFNEFLIGINDKDLTAEYVLPSFVGKELSAGVIDIRVLRTDAEWFGVTYREDRASVAKRLLEFKQNGVYPEGLTLKQM